jgi:hypothetical protein
MNKKFIEKKWKRCVGGAFAILIGIGSADSFGAGGATAGRSGTAPRASQVRGGQGLGDDAEESLRELLDEVEEKLSAATEAMGTLKARVFDSHNHAVQAEFLKLVQMASESGRRAEAAWTILRNLLQNSPQKPLFVRALASAMGGAKWISKRISTDPVKLSNRAIQILLKFSKGGAPLSHEDCAEISRQLRNNKVFINGQSPFWAAVRSLTPLEREQLPDCFGPYPRSVYEKIREYNRIKDRQHQLYNQIHQHVKKNRELGNLIYNLRCSSGVDLERNGFTIPEDITPILATVQRALHHKQYESDTWWAAGYSDSLLYEFVLAKPWTLIRTPAPQTKQYYFQHPPSTPRGQALCQAFIDANALYSPEAQHGDTLISLDQKLRGLEEEINALAAAMPWVPEAYKPQDDWGPWGLYHRDNCLWKGSMAYPEKGLKIKKTPFQEGISEASASQ